MPAAKKNVPRRPAAAPAQAAKPGQRRAMARPAEKPQREAVLRNLRRIHGPRHPAIEAIDVARVFATYASCLTEWVIANGSRQDELSAELVGDDRCERAIALGHGVIIATAHTGGWQMAGRFLRKQHAVDVMIVMQRERDPRAQAMQNAAQGRAGVRVAHIGNDPLEALTLLSHLRRRGVVAVQIDRRPPGMRCREVPLFGQPFSLPEGPLLLAAVSGAPIVPVFTRRVRYMRYEIHVGEPVFVPRKPTAAQLDAAARATIGAMERFLRDNPTQWFHFE